MRTLRVPRSERFWRNPIVSPYPPKTSKILPGPATLTLHSADPHPRPDIGKDCEAIGELFTRRLGATEVKLSSDTAAEADAATRTWGENVKMMWVDHGGSNGQTLQRIPEDWVQSPLITMAEVACVLSGTEPFFVTKP